MKNLSINYALNNEEEIFKFYCSVKSLIKCNDKSSLSFNVFVFSKRKEKLKKELLKIKGKLKINLIINEFHGEEKKLFNKLIKSCRVPAISKIFVPFFSKEEFCLILDNDTFPLLKLDEVFKLDNDLPAVNRRSSSGNGYQQEYWKTYFPNDFEKLKSAHGNGGVVLINCKKYFEVLKTPIYVMQNIIPEYVNNVSLLQKENSKLNVDDENFYTLLFFNNPINKLSPRLNLTLYYNWENFNRIISERHCIFHFMVYPNRDFVPYFYESINNKNINYEIVKDFLKEFSNYWKLPKSNDIIEETSTRLIDIAEELYE